MVLSIADFFRRMHRREEGFTLIELLIVIAILAVLAAIAIPLVVNRIDDARISADKANVAQLQSAVDLYILDSEEDGSSLTPLAAEASGSEGGFITTLQSAGYLQKVVSSPWSGHKYQLVAATGTGNLVVKSTAQGTGDGFKYE